MPPLLIHINQSLPKHVPVLVGAAEELVKQRELRNKYETNRNIKTWSCWFLLKALTSSGKIQHWQRQANYLLHYTQMNRRSFYRRLTEMQALKLITIEDSHIHLLSYEKAAQLLDIVYIGLNNIQYDPDKQKGKQMFQYLLRGEEFRAANERQFNGLHFQLDKNPPLKTSLHHLLVKADADVQRLYKDRHYFRECLLQLQMQLFKEGSDIQEMVFAHRADINRSVSSIQKAHGFKAMQSVSYCKRRMRELELIQVEKKRVESTVRSRLYVPEGTGRRDGYKYNSRTGRTVWFLCDQIYFLYESIEKKQCHKKAMKAV